MKLAVYGPSRLGLVIGERIVDLQRAAAVCLSSKEEAEALVGHTLRDFLYKGDEALRTAREVHPFAKQDLDGLRGGRGEKVHYRLSGVKLRAPVTESSRFKIMCIGANFADHFVGLAKNAPASMGREKKTLTLEEARAQALSTPPWDSTRWAAASAT